VIQSEAPQASIDGKFIPALSAFENLDHKLFHFMITGASEVIIPTMDQAERQEQQRSILDDEKLVSEASLHSPKSVQPPAEIQQHPSEAKRRNKSASAVSHITLSSDSTSSYASSAGEPADRSKPRQISPEKGLGETEDPLARPIMEPGTVSE